jgi:hypothetical protein
VDDHLVALSRGSGIEALVEGRLGEQRQRVGLLLRQGGRFRGNVPRAGVSHLHPARRGRAAWPGGAWLAAATRVAPDGRARPR